MCSVCWTHAHRIFIPGSRRPLFSVVPLEKLRPKVFSFTVLCGIRRSVGYQPGEEIDSPLSTSISLHLGLGVQLRAQGKATHIDWVPTVCQMLLSTSGPSFSPEPHLVLFSLSWLSCQTECISVLPLGDSFSSFACPISSAWNCLWSTPVHSTNRRLSPGYWPGVL